jgi:DNA-binding transcriptional ArsR family regulator
MLIAKQGHFAYGQTMHSINSEEIAVSRIAAAIGEPARTRILYCLLDGHARTGTELAIVAEVTPSTASVHLNKLKEERLIKVQAQGRHRYYSLEGPRVARALESLSVLAGGTPQAFVPNTPARLRAARTCYDHMAGAVAVRLHDRFLALRWIETERGKGGIAYDVTAEGARAFTALGIDLDAARSMRRRFVYGCLDWSERRPHLGGALGAAFLILALKKRWVDRDLDSRALTVTAHGRREMRDRFGAEL